MQVHQYKSNGLNIVLDVPSSSVHIADDLFYDAVELMGQGKSGDEIREILKERFRGRAEYSPGDIDEVLAEAEELKSQGTLFSPEPYRPAIEEFAKRPTVVKALCLHIAHDCNLACRYCFAEEGEYSDSLFDSITIDSQGLYARHTETSFEIGYEATVEDAHGNHYSNFWWDAAPLLKDLKLGTCSKTAIERASAALFPVEIDSCRTNLIVDSECAGKLVTPLLNALGGFAVQQKNSFLADKLGKKIFPENLSIIDLPRVPGQTGCRLFDSEGVATKDLPVIENGVVKTFFINTYIGHKMGVEPTIEDATRVKLMPVGECVTQEDLLREIGDGILVTGFNGGNSNAATGNFSYGIEGFLIRGGKKVHPVREMLITGDFISLWNNLVATARDARPCMSKLIPTLAFKDVSFSA